MDVLGQVVGGYRLVSRLAGGGSGEVFLAEHERISRRVAIKLLLPEYCQRANAVARFLAEARAASEVRHPNVVEIFDCGPAGPGGRAFIVMEYLEGMNLRAYLELPPRDDDVAASCGIVRRLGEGLLAIHGKRLVHRDVKPENVFLSLGTGSVDAEVGVKLLDFGIARPVDDLDRVFRTRPGSLLGTPAYMAPEQARGAERLDPRADVYALGCVFFELLAGRPPFSGNTAAELLVLHQSEPPRAPSEFRARGGVTDELDRLVLGMLNKSPEDRPSVSIVMHRLDAIMGPRVGRLRVSDLGVARVRALRSDEATLAPASSFEPSRHLSVGAPTLKVAELVAPTGRSPETQRSLEPISTAMPAAGRTDRRIPPALKWIAAAAALAVLGVATRMFVSEPEQSAATPRDTALPAQAAPSNVVGATVAVASPSILPGAAPQAGASTGQGSIAPAPAAPSVIPRRSPPSAARVERQPAAASQAPGAAVAPTPAATQASSAELLDQRR